MKCEAGGKLRDWGAKEELGVRGQSSAVTERVADVRLYSLVLCCLV